MSNAEKPKFEDEITKQEALLGTRIMSKFNPYSFVRLDKIVFIEII